MELADSEFNICKEREVFFITPSLLYQFPQFFPDPHQIVLQNRVIFFRSSIILHIPMILFKVQVERPEFPQQLLEHNLQIMPVEKHDRVHETIKVFVLGSINHLVCGIFIARDIRIPILISFKLSIRLPRPGFPNGFSDDSLGPAGGIPRLDVFRHVSSLLHPAEQCTPNPATA